MSSNHISSKYVSVDAFADMHYLEKGEGRPLLFIPGLTFGAEIFKQQLEYFSGKYRVIAVDPRGQGLSGKPAHGNDYTTHGKDLNALIEALDLRHITLVGWSTGNLDIWSYISQYGMERVAAAVTIDMSPRPLSADPDCWVEGSIDELREAVQVLNTPQGVRDFFRSYATDVMIQKQLDDAELEYLLDISAKTPYQICHTLFANAIMSDYFDTAKMISESSTPSLMFIAEHWADIAEPFMKRNFPGTQTHIMGGHLMFYEYAEKWNQVLSEFLNKNS